MTSKSFAKHGISCTVKVIIELSTTWIGQLMAKPRSETDVICFSGCSCFSDFLSRSWDVPSKARCSSVTVQAACVCVRERGRGRLVIHLHLEITATKQLSCKDCTRTCKWKLRQCRASAGSKVAHASGRPTPCCVVKEHPFYFVSPVPHLSRAVTCR